MVLVEAAPECAFDCGTQAASYAILQVHNELILDLEREAATALAKGALEGVVALKASVETGPRWRRNFH
ncbi:hypothetical protein [Treponema endosymbiont of Eucomonympha sp.]|uniref:hypothetical protein n=1 Tax=Treponema endosymbiont of Eucomonympha sp. TaxID=1580831 RepID=UPI0007512BF2|nr:hypothetical protein [Treponema endosymbiont of Eucomonympha sp.]